MRIDVSIKIPLVEPGSPTIINFSGIIHKVNNKAESLLYEAYRNNEYGEGLPKKFPYYNIEILTPISEFEKAKLFHYYQDPRSNKCFTGYIIDLYSEEEAEKYFKLNCLSIAYSIYTGRNSKTLFRELGSPDEAKRRLAEDHKIYIVGESPLLPRSSHELTPPLASNSFRSF